MGYGYQNSIRIFVRISVRNPSYYYYLLFRFVVCLILNNLRNRIMEKIISIVIAIIVSTISLEAQQTFSGKVVSPIGEPLDCASVVLLNNENGTSLNYTLSEEDGSFSMLLPENLDLENATVVISFLGYKPPENISNFS